MQEWFNQGNALLQSFWFEEAERSFRWCLKLEPNNAMAYWGLAQCGMNWFSIGSFGEKRFIAFLKEAVLRKDFVTERERLYIEAWDAAYKLIGPEARNTMIRRLQTLCLKYPEDNEAKVQLAFYNIDQGSALANEALIQQVLRSSPNHPGAHHARIHNWDGMNGAAAVASCEKYGKVAPNIGHSRHMPGHIYSKIGMWHEAAIAMDSATRVELRYMNERLALPFETWNYAHNRDYLSYIQEQLGMGTASLQGSLDVWNAPTDPQATGKDSRDWLIGPMLRCLIKFERWNVILDGTTLPRVESGDAVIEVKCSEALALICNSKISDARARLAEAKELLKKNYPDEKAQADHTSLVMTVTESRLKIIDGDRAGAILALKAAADKETKQREKEEYANDPAREPWPIVRILGDVYYQGGEYAQAIACYTEGLSQELNDGWCLAGLSLAHHALAQMELSRSFAARMLAVWQNADSDLKIRADVLKLHPNLQPQAVTLKPERTYRPESLAKLGPSNWEPFSAPLLKCRGTDGKPVSLQDFRGKNVLLIFFLNDQCVHCVEQLQVINKRMTELLATNTEVVAVCSTTPELLKSSSALAPFQVKLLSDTNHENARRFSSYDDFENMELHSTILIDAQGRVRWKRTGGDPFSDVDFLLREIRRIR